MSPPGKGTNRAYRGGAVMIKALRHHPMECGCRADPIPDSVSAGPFSHLRRWLPVTAIVTVALAVWSTSAVSASPPGPAPKVIKGAEVSEPVTAYSFDVDLRRLPEIKGWQPGDPVFELPRQTYPPLREKGPPASTARTVEDPLLQAQRSVSVPAAGRDFATAILNIDGIPFTGVFPPDTVGDVGPNHYIQMVNGTGGTVLGVIDKSGSILAGPIELDSLWTVGGNCASGGGDPIVLYDRLADRWLMAEFADRGNHLCVYISKSPDPVSGGWWLYDFPTPNFPDYPKYAVWPDAYYVSSNEFSPVAYALDRDKMLQGLPATSQRFTAPGLPGFSFQALIPSDLDGAKPPPAGSPNYFMRHRDDEAHDLFPDPTQDFVEIWEFRVDWNNPLNSSLTGPFEIPVAEFDSDLCGLVSFECFPQPGTSVGLDPLREVVMWRLQYRNFGTHETLVGNFVTDVDGTDHGGIRWFELHKTLPIPWQLHQEGTYAPDLHHRWMGSIAMDANSNIALGYSLSSTTLFPSIAYTGRLASDPPGTLPRGENTLIIGSSSQTAETRWGDYSAMNVDPADDCTFWYTNEYNGIGFGWLTRIGAFRFDSCDAQAILAVDIKNDQDVYTIGDTINTTISINNGTGASIDGDIWLVIRLADGTFLYYPYWTPTPQPAVSCISIGPGPLVTDFPVLTYNIPPGSDGTYTWYAPIVPCGADVTNLDNWTAADVEQVFINP